MAYNPLDQPVSPVSPMGSGRSGVDSSMTAERSGWLRIRGNDSTMQQMWFTLQGNALNYSHTQNVLAQSIHLQQ